MQERVALSVNINKIALIRNSRSGNYPDLLAWARQCLALGADGITVHPRPDQRHIRADDIAPLAALINEYRNQTPHSHIEFNMEGNPFAEVRDSYPAFMALVQAARPQQCTLVPDTDSQLTSDHGFDLTRDGERLKPIITELHAYGCRVSLFMDADCEQISRARAIGADRIELYTGPYAEAFARGDSGQREQQLAAHAKAAAHAASLGLGVNAGHDLNLDNLPALVHALPAMAEVSIGHALTVDALQLGLPATIAAYRQALQRAVPD